MPRWIWIPIVAGLGVSAPVSAQELDVPVMETASDDLDTCGVARVKGLKADGDGFLAVRSGPGTTYRKLDELREGDPVWVFEQRGAWVGIVHGVPTLDCPPIEKTRPVPHDGKKGWVHEAWIDFIAG